MNQNSQHSDFGVAQCHPTLPFNLAPVSFDGIFCGMDA